MQVFQKASVPELGLRGAARRAPRRHVGAEGLGLQLSNRIRSTVYSPTVQSERQGEVTVIQ